MDANENIDRPASRLIYLDILINFPWALLVMYFMHVFTISPYIIPGRTWADGTSLKYAVWTLGPFLLWGFTGCLCLGCRSTKSFQKSPTVFPIGTSVAFLVFLNVVLTLTLAAPLLEILGLLDEMHVWMFFGLDFVILLICTALLWRRISRNRSMQSDDLLSS